MLALFQITRGTSTSNVCITCCFKRKHPQNTQQRPKSNHSFVTSFVTCRSFEHQKISFASKPKANKNHSEIKNIPSTPLLIPSHPGIPFFLITISILGIATEEDSRHLPLAVLSVHRIALAEPSGRELREPGFWS